MCYIGDSTGLYFYSAVFQGNMALLAFVGVFVVFRLQALNSQIALLEQRLFGYVENFFRLRGDNPPPLQARNPGEILDALKKVSEWKKDESGQWNTEPIAKNAGELRDQDEWLKSNISSWIALGKKRNEIVNGLWLPIIAISVVCFFSLYLLTTAEGVHKYCECTEAMLFGIVIIANIVAVALTILYAFRCLKPVSNE